MHWEPNGSPVKQCCRRRAYFSGRLSLFQFLSHFDSGCTGTVQLIPVFVITPLPQIKRLRFRTAQSQKQETIKCDQLYNWNSPINFTKLFQTAPVFLSKFQQQLHKKKIGSGAGSQMLRVTLEYSLLCVADCEFLAHDSENTPLGVKGTQKS